MAHRITRFSRAFWHESVKRLPYILAILLCLGLYGIWQSYRRTAEAVQLAKDNTMDIKRIVEGQSDLLIAIKQVAEDNQLISEQKTNIIICMLQVPVNERTTDTVTNCRKKVETQPSPAQITSQPSSSSSQTPPGQGQEAPQEATEEPPKQQSIIPGIDEPLVGCLMRVCI